MADDGYIKIKTKIEGLAESLKGIKDLGLGVFGLSSIYKTLTGTVKQLYAALDDLNKAYKVQKNAEVQLTTAVKNNPYLDASSARRLKDYAAQLQKISTVGDEQLLPFMAQLAASGRTETQIMDIMKAALDANASGMISLDEAVRGLNNSYTGQIGRLGMQIPALKKLTKEELEQGKAVDVVANTYKGLAEETAKATGSTEQLKNAWGDLKEEMGKDVERTFGPIRRFLADLIKARTATLQYMDAQKQARRLLEKDTGSITPDDLSVLQQRRNDILADISSGYKQGLELRLLQMELVEYNKKISAVLEIRDAQKETAQAEEAAADRAAKEAEEIKTAEETRAEYIAKNAEQRQKNLESMRLEAQLRGEQIDDEALLDEYIRSYIDLLTETPGLVRAEDAEAKELLETIQKQSAAVQARIEAEEKAQAEKKAAEEAAAQAEEWALANERKKAELRKAEQKQAEEMLAAFQRELDSISAPDKRTLQEQLADRQRALENFYQEIISMEIISDAEKEELEEEFTRKRAALIEQQKQAEMEAINELKQARKDLARESLDSLASTVNTFSSIAKENSKARLDVRIAEIEAEELSEEEKNKKILEAQKKAAREQYRIELWQWTVSSLQAAANIAEGISKCFAQQGPYGFITSALVAAAGAAQIATIIASKPQPPAFATGGVVPGNSYTGDRVQAMVNSGEMILTRQQQARLFDIANGAGSGETNINIKNYRANDVDVTASVSGHDIELIIDKRVNASMAAGRYNKAYGIMQNNYAGQRITN